MGNKIKMCFKKEGSKVSTHQKVNFDTLTKGRLCFKVGYNCKNDLFMLAIFVCHKLNLT